MSGFRGFFLFLTLLAFSQVSHASSQIQWDDSSSAGDTVTLPENTTMSNLNGKLLLLTGQTDGCYLITGTTLAKCQLDEDAGNRSPGIVSQDAHAVFVVGGMIAGVDSNTVNQLTWDEEKQRIVSVALPEFPYPVANGTAAVVGGNLFVVDIQQAGHFHKLDIQPQSQNGSGTWTALAFPTFEHALSSVKIAGQNDGSGDKLYSVFQLENGQSQLWQYDPSASSEHWKQVSDNSPPNLISLNPFGQSHLFAMDSNGISYSFNAITKSWARYGQQSDASKRLLSTAIKISDSIYALAQNSESASGTHLESALITPIPHHFGWVNMSVLFLYLASVVLVGLYFMAKNRNTDDYFRGGQSIPWWAAACSIYATMLSSLTYVALPAIVYQTNWILLLGILTIILVAPIAIYVAIPFFRQIDATSAYEYLSKRFNLAVRLFASGLFTLFHLGRMGIVMALTALALSAVTPLNAADSVLLMGVLCLIYCTLGGIEAVIWTDTIQTIVLLIGALLCFIYILSGLDNGMQEFIAVGIQDSKFTLVDADFSASSITSLALWVIVLGGIGQNISSYTADQAVVQRYMVTPSLSAAKKSIWTNALIAGPASVLFFCIGTGLYVFYKSHPALLDPTQQIDQIFPHFISTQLPVGLAGLIVAGIFAAAQSTVSTSMNSIATTIVTDFVRPFSLVNSEQGYMRVARWLTFGTGVLGTLAGLIFIDPAIRSLMEAYFKVIGMFMGALGGLFVLGALTKRANAFGAFAGLIAGVGIMISAWQLGWANGYLYGTIGILSCLVIGYVASLLTADSNKDIDGLTLYTMKYRKN